MAIKTEREYRMWLAFSNVQNQGVIAPAVIFHDNLVSRYQHSPQLPPCLHRQRVHYRFLNSLED